MINVGRMEVGGAWRIFLFHPKYWWRGCPGSQLCSLLVLAGRGAKVPTDVKQVRLMAPGLRTGRQAGGQAGCCL